MSDQDPRAIVERMAADAKAKAEEREKQRQAAAEEHRKRYPEIAEIVDALRARGMFGKVERIYKIGK